MNSARRALSACVLTVTMVVTGCNPTPKATDMEVRWEASQQTYSALVPAAHVSALRDYLPIAFKWARRPLKIYVHMEGETSCRSKHVSMLEMAVREFDHNIPGRFTEATSSSDPNVVIDISPILQETLLTPRRIRPMALKYLRNDPPFGGHGRAIYYEPTSSSIVFGYVQDTTTCLTVDRSRENALLHDHLLSDMAYLIEPHSGDENADRRLSGFRIISHLRQQTTNDVVGMLLYAKLVDLLTRR